MKKFFFGWIICLFLSVPLLAQQNIGENTNVKIKSPEINPDGTVTLRLKIANAQNVSVKGDWMEEGDPGKMTKGPDGVWTYTSKVLLSDLYIYTFNVDGTTIIDPVSPYQIRDVGSLFSIFLVEGGDGDFYKINSVAHGTVARRWYDSPSLKIKRQISIYTPPGYESDTKKFPVLYLLHGMGGDEEAWITLGRTAQILDNLIAQNKAKPMIVVMPNGNVVQTAAPGESDKGFPEIEFYLPQTMDGTYEASFKDIISFVESNYRVEKSKSGRAVTGLSMGGFHSLYISANYPATFDYVGLFSPAVNPRNEVPSPIYKDIDQKLLQQKQNGYKLYWIGIGKDDFLYDEVKDYRKKLDGMDFPYTYVETSRGHIWSNWRKYMLEFVPLLFK